MFIYSVLWVDQLRYTHTFKHSFTNINMLKIHYSDTWSDKFTYTYTHIHIYTPSDTQAFIYLPKISHITLVSKCTHSLIHTRVIANSHTFQTCSLCVYAQSYTFIYSCKFLVININIVTNIIAHKHAHTDLEAHKFTHFYKNPYIDSHIWAWMTSFEYTADPWTTRVSPVWVHLYADFFQ